MPPDPCKTDPRVRRTRQMLYQAFQDLLAEKTFDSVSVQDIAERSTLNRATFYDHFPDKFALLESMIGDRFSTLVAARMPGPGRTCEGSLRQLILAACDFLSEVSSGCQKHQRQFEPIVESRVKAIVREFLLEGLQQHGARNAELKATMVSWAITGAALQWSRERKTSADELADAVLPTLRTALEAGSRMEIGIDSFVATLADPTTGALMDPTLRLRNLLEEVERADEAGLDVFGIGEHHRAEFLDSAPVVLLAAAAARTRHIRLASAVTVLSAHDPVRVFQDFATLDLISQGRAEIVAGRGSFTEAYPLFGLDLRDYDSLFAEKLDLLLKIRDQTRVHWSGRHRPPLTGQEIFPRPQQAQLPIWIGVGGTPASFVRAGMLGLPLMVAIIGGEFRRFRGLIELYREAGRKAGHAPELLKVGIHALGYVADTNARAADEFFPGYARMFSQIGRERGWPPITRAQFDALLEPTGALLIGDPEAVAAKIRHVDEVLGGISRLNVQMSPGTLPHDCALHAIDLLGGRVAPRVRQGLAEAAPPVAT